MEPETDLYTRALLKLGGPSKNKWQWRKVVLTSASKLRYYDEKDSLKGTLNLDGGFFEYVQDKSSATCKKLDGIKRPSAPSSLVIATDVQTPGYFGVVEKNGGKPYYFCCALRERQWWEETLKEATKGSHKLQDLVQIRKLGGPSQTVAQQPPASAPTPIMPSIWSTDAPAAAGGATSPVASAVPISSNFGLPSRSSLPNLPTFPMAQSPPIANAPVRTSIGGTMHLPPAGPSAVTPPPADPHPAPVQTTAPTTQAAAFMEQHNPRRRAVHMSGVHTPVRPEFSQPPRPESYHPGVAPNLPHQTNFTPVTQPIAQPVASTPAPANTQPIVEEDPFSLTYMQNEINSFATVQPAVPVVPAVEFAIPEPQQDLSSMSEEERLMYEQQRLLLVLQMQQQAQEQAHAAGYQQQYQMAAPTLAATSAPPVEPVQSQHVLSQVLYQPELQTQTSPIATEMYSQQQPHFEHASLPLQPPHNQLTEHPQFAQTHYQSHSLAVPAQQTTQPTTIDGLPEVAAFAMESTFRFDE